MFTGKELPCPKALVPVEPLSRPSRKEVCAFKNFIIEEISRQIGIAMANIHAYMKEENPPRPLGLRGLIDVP